MANLLMTTMWLPHGFTLAGHTLLHPRTAALAERGGYYMRCRTPGPCAIPDRHRSRQHQPKRRQAAALPKRAVVALTMAPFYFPPSEQTLGGHDPAQVLAPQ